MTALRETTGVPEIARRAFRTRAYVQHRTKKTWMALPKPMSSPMHTHPTQAITSYEIYFRTRVPAKVPCIKLQIVNYSSLSHAARSPSCKSQHGRYSNVEARRTFHAAGTALGADLGPLAWLDPGGSEGWQMRLILLSFFISAANVVMTTDVPSIS